MYTLKLQLYGCQYDNDGRCMEMNVNVSDWVHGRTGEGEMVYGFAESVDGQYGVVTLYVVKSDNEEREGKFATVRQSKVKLVADIESEDLRHVDVASLADRSPLETSVVGVPERRYAEPVEVTAYFVIAEALANAAQLSHASSITIRIE